MTQYGGPIVQGFGRCKNWRAHRRGVLGVSGRDDFGQPGKSAAGAKVLPGETDLALPGPLPFILSAPTAATGRRRLHRWAFSAPAEAPSDIRLQLRDDGLILNDNGGRSIHFEPLLPGRRCTAAVSQCGWCAVVGSTAGRPYAGAAVGALPPDIRLSPHLYGDQQRTGAVVDTGVV